MKNGARTFPHLYNTCSTDVYKRQDYYRQDFNMQPDIYWAANDEPGRTGMKEIRHIEGLYYFWDYLLSRFPNLLIDNCASGGRRIDWETIGRSAPLWRSDYYHYDDPDVYKRQV